MKRNIKVWIRRRDSTSKLLRIAPRSAPPEGNQRYELFNAFEPHIEHLDCVSLDAKLNWSYDGDHLYVKKQKLFFLLLVIAILVAESKLRQTSKVSSIFMDFVNLGVANSGAAMFDMPSHYSAEIGSANVRTDSINAPKVLQFFPLTTYSKRGIMWVIKRDIMVNHRNSTTFQIGMSGEWL